jgi:hypothetical protein
VTGAEYSLKVTLQQSVAKCSRGSVREHVEECFRRSDSEGDVEEHGAHTRMPFPLSEQMDEYPCLLVARAGDAELVGHRSEAAVGVGDHPARTVEPHQSGEQPRIETGSRAGHPGSVRWLPVRL